MKNLNKQIENAVSDYRDAAKSYKAAKDEIGQRAFRTLMDRASGKIDLLYELKPTATAWRTTGWTH